MRLGYKSFLNGELGKPVKKKIKEDYKKYINLLNESIHSTIDMDSLSEYEKRKIIFRTVCTLHNFDYEGFYDKVLNKFYNNKISEINKNKESVHINNLLSDFFAKDRERAEQLLVSFLKETGSYSDALFKTLIKKIDDGDFDASLCPYYEAAKVVSEHVLSNFEADCIYKKLLELNDIYAVRVICNNQLPIDHGVVLVYDSESGNFSFDDVSSCIIGFGSKDDCFDYDYEGAKKLGQGLRKPDLSFDETNFFGVGIASYHNGILDSDESKKEWYRSFGIEDGINIVFSLPENIRSVKNGYVTK